MFGVTGAGNNPESQFVEIDAGKYVDIFEKCQNLQKLNLGSTIVHKGNHPELGVVILVDPGNERIGLITM